MAKSRSPGYEPGNHWVICDRCGFAYRADEMMETWDGLVVCEKDWETRHPQELIRVPAEDPAAKEPVRTEPQDEFIEVTFASEPTPIPDGTFNNDL